MGTATTGSSEAIMLGGLSLKRRWQEKMKKAGKDIHNPGPNIVMGAEAQVALEKFARYFEVDCRLVPVTKEVCGCFERLDLRIRLTDSAEQLRHVRQGRDEVCR
jgi:glutamate/tyrosine decarboxylase-like PLP-dependent enzyme